jgi:hypothetical protein
MENKKCLECGKSFSTKWSVQKYCCEKCEKKAWTNRVKYYQRPEVKIRINEWSKEYSQRPEVKERLKLNKKNRFCKCGKELIQGQKKYCNNCKPKKIRIERYCKLCNQQLETYNKSYCNKCKENNKEYFKDIQREICARAARAWYRKPGKKEMVYSNIKRYRDKNKSNINSKNNSRKRTNEFYNRNYYFENHSKLNNKSLFGEKKCRDCGSKIYVQFHHEVYPSKLKEIKQAIKDGKIYFLCRECHGKKRRKED